MQLDPVALVFNPAAGEAGGESAEELRDRLAEHFDDVAIYETTARRGADACARAALAGGARLIVAAGGDGTVSAVASALVGGDVPLGIIPRGTANSIAAALGIPDDPEGACATVVAGHRRDLDTATCGGRTMVLYCTAGIHAETIGQTRRDAKNRWGVLAYVATALRKLSELEPFEVALETDAHVIHCRAVAVTVANLAPVQAIVAQGPSVVVGDDALLDVTIVAATTLGEAVVTGAHLLRSALRHEPASRDNVGYFACRRVRITTTPTQPVLIDGEPAGTTPVTVECRPASLPVIAPPSVLHREHPEAKLAGLPDVEIERKRP